MVDVMAGTINHNIPTKRIQKGWTWETSFWGHRQLQWSSDGNRLLLVLDRPQYSPPQDVLAVVLDRQGAEIYRSNPPLIDTLVAWGEGGRLLLRRGNHNKSEPTPYDELQID
jgi:hypothetical protein